MHLILRPAVKSLNSFQGVPAQVGYLLDCHNGLPPGPWSPLISCPVTTQFPPSLSKTVNPPLLVPGDNSVTGTYFVNKWFIDCRNNIKQYKWSGETHTILLYKNGNVTLYPFFLWLNFFFLFPFVHSVSSLFLSVFRSIFSMGFLFFSSILTYLSILLHIFYRDFCLLWGGGHISLHFLCSYVWLILAPMESLPLLY